jgi:hypothetical protein
VIRLDESIIARGPVWPGRRARVPGGILLPRGSGAGYVRPSHAPSRPAGLCRLEAAISLSASVADALSRGEYLIDLFAAGPELYVFRAGRHTAHFENILEIVACVEACRRNPFETIAPALADELTKHFDGDRRVSGLGCLAPPARPHGGRDGVQRQAADRPRRRDLRTDRLSTKAKSSVEHRADSCKEASRCCESSAECSVFCWWFFKRWRLGYGFRPGPFRPPCWGWVIGWLSRIRLASPQAARRWPLMLAVVYLVQRTVVPRDWYAGDQSFLFPDACLTAQYLLVFQVGQFFVRRERDRLPSYLPILAMVALIFTADIQVRGGALEPSTWCFRWDWSSCRPSISRLPAARRSRLPAGLPPAQRDARHRSCC